MKRRFSAPHETQQVLDDLAQLVALSRQAEQHAKDEGSAKSGGRVASVGGQEIKDRERNQPFFFIDENPEKPAPMTIDQGEFEAVERRLAEDNARRMRPNDSWKESQPRT